MTTQLLMRLEDLWDDAKAAGLSPLELLRYRSNLLGEDLRITNFGGGNTSSKFELPDPLTGQPTRVMAVKGSPSSRQLSAKPQALGKRMESSTPAACIR